MANLPLSAGAATAICVLAVSTASAEPLIWGIEAEQLEYRMGGESDVVAWDANAIVGTDEWKFVLSSEANYVTDEDGFETLENQLWIQTPISDFFDVVGGVRLDTPQGPNRLYGVVGIQGLAPQWFEVKANLFVSDELSMRLEAEYEALITNYLILTPTVEFNLPFTDDTEIGIGAWGPTVEMGARLSYDLVDRTVAPYIGVHYERAFGETGALRKASGEGDDSLYFLTGVRLMY